MATVVTTDDMIAALAEMDAHAHGLATASARFLLGLRQAVRAASDPSAASVLSEARFYDALAHRFGELGLGTLLAAVVTRDVNRPRTTGGESFVESWSRRVRRWVQ